MKKTDLKCSKLVFPGAGPLIYPLLLWLSGLLILSLSRAILVAVYWDRISEAPDLLRIFMVGIRMDAITLAYLTITPTLLLLLLSKALIVRVRTIFAGIAALILGLLVYMEFATHPFMAEYDLRPDVKFIEYLGSPREVLGMLFKTYGVELVVAALGIVVIALIVARIGSGVIQSYTAWSFKRRMIYLPFVAALLVLAARSSLSHRPANLSTAAFSTNHLVNELALNSTYTLMYAVYRTLKEESDPSRMYGKMRPEEVFKRIERLTGYPAFADGSIPFLHEQSSQINRTRPPNIVIFLQESLGAPEVGCLGGPPLTPNLCALKDEGLWFTNLHATGTRTARGIEAVLTGFLPSANKGVIKLENAKRDFFNAASLLKQHGYSTEFHYGGVSNFDEMKAFCLGNGFDEIFDQSTFKDPVFTGTWGVSDEDLVRRANDVFVAHGDKPFFALMLSTTNHVPFEFPDGRIELFEQPKQTNRNAVRYADYAIGLMFELAKKEQYFKNTIFVVVADHNMAVRGNDLVPVDKFQVPALMIGPNIPRKEISILSSQIDLLPTLLHFSGLDTVHPMVGRNLMELPAGAKGRAFMQFAENNAYRVEDDVIVQQPFLGARQFVVKGGKLVPAELDPEFAADALAYAHLPWLLYSKKQYRVAAK